MPAESEKQRRYLFMRFGKAWVDRHGFNNKGKLPMYANSKTRQAALVKRLKGQ